MPFLKPRRLEPGDHVRIVSPSGPVTEQLLADAIEQLEHWDLRVSLDESALARTRYLAGTDEVRRSAVQSAIDDDDVDAILFSRGGYGAMRIVTDLDFSRLRDNPRIMSGFSDITALHLAAQRAGLATLHGHVAKSFSSQPEDLELFRATLFGERGELCIPVVTIRAGQAMGPIIGGNLSLVAAMAAARQLPPLRSALLFLEDVTEEDYRLDRLFTSLRLNPAFSDVAGVILGDFDSCAGAYVCEEEMPAFLTELGAELGEAWDVPVVMNFPAGHAARNVPLALGVVATLDADRGVVIQHEELVT